MNVCKSYKREDGSFLSAFSLRDIPFEVQRVFLVSSSDNEICQRGAHAHYKGRQLLVCVSGKIEINYENRESKGTLQLNPGESYNHPNLEWLDVVFKEKNSLLLSFCSDEFNEEDYIREYRLFQDVIKNLC